MPAPASTPKRLRADAQHNRDALLATARAVFARLGTDVPLEVVAQEAGVGRGTLYRHFPSREHMLAAIMRDNAAVLEERACELIEAPELPGGLADWLRLYDRFATDYPGMSAHVRGLADDESPIAGTCGPMKDSFARLWDRAQREGRARRDVTATQALALISSLPKEPATGRTARPYLDVALEGLQVLTGTPTRLPTWRSFPTAGTRSPSTPAGPVETTKTLPLWWTDGVGQADPGHFRLRRT